MELATLLANTAGIQPWRRVFHASNGVILALAPESLGLAPIEVRWLLFAVVVLLAALDVARLMAPELNILFFRALPSLASPKEQGAIASSTWYALGALLTWVLFPPQLAVPAILVLAFADPSASVVGRLIGTRRFGKGSVEGSLVFFLVACVVLWLWVGQPAVIAVAATVALLEILPGPIDDNFTVPVGAAALLMLLVP